MKMQQSLPAELERKHTLLNNILESKSFLRAPRLASMLSYIVNHALSGGDPGELTEHRLGVRVFGRSEDYSPMEDSIVRSTARLLRQRLAEYYEQEGRNDPWRIEIPKGRYAAEFVGAAEAASPQVLAEVIPAVPLPADPAPQVAPPGRRHWLRLAAAGAAASALGVVAYQGFRPPNRLSELWRKLLQPGKKTFLVLADTALVFSQDLLGAEIPVEEYFSGGWKQRMMDQGNRWFSSEESRWFPSSLVERRYTGLVDAEFAFRVARRPEAEGADIKVRFARDLHVQDARGANLIVVGAAHANPWVKLLDSGANFRIQWNSQKHNFTALNRKPAAGEPETWESKGAERVFGLVGFIEKPDRDGNALLLCGASIAGTECAMDHIVRPEMFDELMRRIGSGGSGVPHFEALMQTASLGGNAASATVLSSRVYREA